MPKAKSIFISYRREDSEDIAGRIYDRLKAHFGAESVFFDIDTIPLGIDFEEYIDKSVSQCQIFLAIIGKTWLTITDDQGIPRLASETDFVRLEIETALRLKIPVIPLRVSQARIPKKEELPESLQTLVTRNGTQIRSGKDFHKDLDELIQGIEQHLKPLASPKSPPRSSASTKRLSSPSPDLQLDVVESTPIPLKAKLTKFRFEVVTVDARGQVQARQVSSTEHFLEKLVDGVVLDMVRIPKGHFLMGSSRSEEGKREWEGPQHRVNVPEFFLGRYPITQAQWKVVAELERVNRTLKTEPSHFKGANRPVECVSWHDAIEFCNRISRLTGKTYTLPSEAQWEYACRAGTTTPFHCGKTLTDQIVNFAARYVYAQSSKGRYRNQTSEVGKFPANAFGLSDMHGNVLEWCQDVWHRSYNEAPSDGRPWLENDTNASRVRRGGAWGLSPRNCRSAYRFYSAPDNSLNLLGFRVACSTLINS